MDPYRNELEAKLQQAEAEMEHLRRENARLQRIKAPEMRTRRRHYTALGLVTACCFGGGGLFFTIMTAKAKNRIAVAERRVHAAEVGVKRLREMERELRSTGEPRPVAQQQSISPRENSTRVLRGPALKARLARCARFRLNPADPDYAYSEGVVVRRTEVVWRDRGRSELMIQTSDRGAHALILESLSRGDYPVTNISAGDIVGISWELAGVWRIDHIRTTAK